MDGEELEVAVIKDLEQVEVIASLLQVGGACVCLEYYMAVPVEYSVW